MKHVGAPLINLSIERLNQLHETTALLGQRCVAFHPRLVQLTGRVTAGLLLSQAIYWTRKLALSDPARQGWFWKTREDWRNETGLSRREQDHSRRTLKSLGLWQEKRVGMPARVWYRVDLEKLGQMLEPAKFAGWDWRNERAVIQLLGRPFLFYRTLSDIAGAATSAVLLSNMLSHERNNLKRRESLADWRTYQFDQLNQQTGLTRHELISARKALRAADVITERCLGLPPRVEWRIELNRLIGLLAAVNSRAEAVNSELRQSNSRPAVRAVAGFSGNVPSCLPEFGKQDCRKPANKIAGFRQSDYPETYQLDIGNRTDWKSGNDPTCRANSGETVGRIPDPHIQGTTGFITTTPTPPAPSPNSECIQAPALAGRRWFDGLIWPRTLCQEERESAIRLLSDVQADAQLLLDELAGQTLNGSKVISQPINYLTVLARKAKAGEFIPAAALREQARRNRIVTERKDREVAAVKPPKVSQDDQARVRQQGLAMLRSFVNQKLNQRRPD
jgi:hypothetical protein